MKTKFLSLASAVAFILGMSACQDPQEFSPSHYEENLLSMTASFYNDTRIENSFPAEIDHAAGIINIVFPYTYPNLSESNLEDEDLTHVRVQCNLTTGATVSPELTWLDLSKEHQITVTGLDGTKKQYTIKSEIRKSADCFITDFSIDELGLGGVINQDASTITFITPDEIGEQLATVIASHGATLEPDPRITPLNYDGDVKIKVTAQNGVNTKEYTFLKAEPKRLPAGANFGTASMRWVKKLSEYGYKSTGLNDATSGLAVTGNHLVINQTGNANPIYINLKTGVQEGTINLASIGNNTAGVLNNYRMTSDDAGYIVISNFSKDNNGNLTVWRMKGIDGTPEQYIQCSAQGKNVGDQLSVRGSLDGDAIITATINGGGVDFFRWIVKGGQLQSQNPELVHVNGYKGACWGNSDVAYLNPSDPTSNYICGAYVDFATGGRGLSYVNGQSNTVTSTVEISPNWIENSVDVILFNNVYYGLFNSINSFTWGTDDLIYLYDLSAGDLSTSALDFGAFNFLGQYGANADTSTGTGLGRNGGDVKLVQSSNGIYLYILFMYANGSVGMIQADCLDQ